MRESSVAVLGAGAVGSFFGGMLARGGTHVTLIGRRAHVDAIRANGLAIERADGTERINIQASEDVRAVAGASLVLLCVKAPDTEEAARSAAPHLAPDALLLSVQNGADNVALIHRATGLIAVAGIVYLAADLVAPGRVRHGGRGDLIIGTLPEYPLAGQTGTRSLTDAAGLFERCGVPCRVAADIRPELWTKMAVNCAYNAISAIAGVRYGELIGNASARDLMLRVTHEVLAVARASGVALEREAVERTVFELARAMPGATSSTAQDLARA
jgi:2-dehydropantoate 2-reductase